MTNFQTNTKDLRALSQEVECLLDALPECGREAAVAELAYKQGQAQATVKILAEMKKAGEKPPTLPVLEALKVLRVADEQERCYLARNDFEAIKLALRARLAQMSAAQTLVKSEGDKQDFAHGKYEPELEPSPFDDEDLRRAGVYEARR